MTGVNTPYVKNNYAASIWHAHMDARGYIESQYYGRKKDCFYPLQPNRPFSHHTHCISGIENKIQNMKANVQ